VYNSQYTLAWFRLLLKLVQLKVSVQLNAHRTTSGTDWNNIPVTASAGMTTDGASRAQAGLLALRVGIVAG